MKEVFKGQSLLTIQLDTGDTDLASAGTYRIYYIKPSKTKGFWPATISGTKLVRQVANGDINESGMWKFQAYYIKGSRVALGQVAEQVFEPSIL
jgi:hypothetical protein